MNWLVLAARWEIWQISETKHEDLSMVQSRLLNRAASFFSSFLWRSLFRWDAPFSAGVEVRLLSMPPLQHPLQPAGPTLTGGQVQITNTI